MCPAAAVVAAAESCPAVVDPSLVDGSLAFAVVYCVETLCLGESFAASFVAAVAVVLASFYSWVACAAGAVEVDPSSVAIAFRYYPATLLAYYLSLFGVGRRQALAKCPVGDTGSSWVRDGRPVDSHCVGMT